MTNAESIENHRSFASFEADEADCEDEYCIIRVGIVVSQNINNLLVITPIPIHAPSDRMHDVNCIMS